MLQFTQILDKVIRETMLKNEHTKNQLKEVTVLKNKDKIIQLYYLEHLKQIEISKILNVSPQYISKIIQSDERYSSEKCLRKKNNEDKRKKYLNDYYKKHKRKKKDDNMKDELKLIQQQDALELSYYYDISNASLIKWTLSAYHSNKKGNLVLDNNLIAPYDMPKIFYRNTKMAPQKYDKKYSFV